VAEQYRAAAAALEQQQQQAAPSAAQEEAAAATARAEALQAEVAALSASAAQAQALEAEVASLTAAAARTAELEAEVAALRASAAGEAQAEAEAARERLAALHARSEALLTACRETIAAAGAANADETQQQLQQLTLHSAEQLQALTALQTEYTALQAAHATAEAERGAAEAARAQMEADCSAYATQVTQTFEQCSQRIQELETALAAQAGAEGGAEGVEEMRTQLGVLQGERDAAVAEMERLRAVNETLSQRGGGTGRGGADDDDGLVMYGGDIGSGAGAVVEKRNGPEGVEQALREAVAELVSRCDAAEAKLSALRAAGVDPDKPGDAAVVKNTKGDVRCVVGLSKTLMVSIILAAVAIAFAASAANFDPVVPM
jgi:hypothetical protein